MQYVDDILLAADTVEHCKEATLSLLHHHATKGHKLSKKKLQYCQSEVTYLGHFLSKEGHTLTKDRLQTILKIPIPSTQKEVRSLIGITSYCRQWIPNFSLIKPFLSLVTKDTPSPLPWTSECQEAYQMLRASLCSAPVLGTPDYAKPFILYVHEREGCALSVLTQPYGNKHRPCAYFSAVLDPVARGRPGCLRAVAVTAISIRQSEGIVLSTKLLVMVPHPVDALLNQTKTQHLTSARLTGYELTLLAPHITLKRCLTLNPATLLPLPAKQT